MKKISLVLMILTMALVFPVRAEDVAALEERVKRLTGYIQDLQENNAFQKKQIEALVKEVSSLREQQQSQPTTTAASNDDLRELARKVQEIERKRETDRDYLEKEFERLAKLIKNTPAASAPVKVPNSSSDLPPNALEHTIASGDTLLAIALAYSKETGRKITTDLIMKANPGLDPRKLQPGQKILVPLP